MDEQINKFKELIEKSQKILITSHISPDPDAFSSMLLLGTTLQLNYPDKNIVMSSEEMPEGLEFLDGYSLIKNQPLLNTINDTDLIIIVDAMNFTRCSRKDFEQIAQKVSDNNIPLAIIDHHEKVGVEENEVYINRMYPAAVEEVYEVLFNDLKLQKPDGWAQTVMTGLYSDTGGFSYLNDRFEETLDLVKELVSNGVGVEKIRNKLNQYTLDNLRVVNELFANIKSKGDCTYSFISDEFVEKWLRNDKSFSDIHFGVKIFTEYYLRNIEGRPWGFIIYPDPLVGEGCYSVSFRALNGYKDVATLANKLGGGGHKASAGAKVKAKSIEAACEAIIQTIAD